MQHPPVIHAVDLYVVYRRWINCTDTVASLVYVLFTEHFSKNWAEGTCKVDNARRILHVLTQPYAQELLLLSDIQYIHACVKNFKYCCTLGCHTMESGRNVLTLQRTIRVREYIMHVTTTFGLYYFAVKCTV
jgi:hypothetical protein